IESSFVFQAEDGIRDFHVTGVQTCALPIFDHVREVVREIAETGAIPIVIGGDHSLEYPNLAAAADVHGKGTVGVVHFDSHYDVRSEERRVGEGRGYRLELTQCSRSEGGGRQ